MNFLVQSLIQDLENMGHFLSSVSEKEWQDKWATINQLEPDEKSAVFQACELNPYRKKALQKALESDPDPAKSARKVAFDGLFKL